MSNRHLPKGSLILVIGATGTIGAAVVDEALKVGYKVRAPVRSAEKGGALIEEFDRRYGAGSVITVPVADFLAPGAFDEAMKGCAGVVHLASEMTNSPDPNKMIPPSVALVENALKTAAKTSSVKRFVFTSSQAVLPPQKVPGTINGSSWHPDADKLIAYAWAEPYTPEKSMLVYLASKICAERACWKFVEREKPSFVLNTVIPGFSIGEVFHPKLFGSSNRAISGLLISYPFAVGFIKGISPTSFVNVQDCGRLHVAALKVDRVQGKRLLALAGEMTFNGTVDLLQRLVPQNNLPPKEESPARSVAMIDTAYEQELLKELGKNGFTDFEKTLQVCLSTAKVSGQ